MGWNKVLNTLDANASTIGMGIGAGVGAAVGSIIPGAGTVAGATIGAGLGSAAGSIAGSLYESPAEKKAKKKANKTDKYVEQSRAEWNQYLADIRPTNESYKTYIDALNSQMAQIQADPLAAEMEARYSGKKPSAAEMLLKKTQEDNLRQQMATVASARGGVNYAALARRTSDNLAALQQKSAQDAAIMRAQEQERMLGQWAQYQQQQRQTQLSILSNAFNANSIRQGQQMQYASALGSIAQFDQDAAIAAMNAYNAQRQEEQQRINAGLATGASLLSSYATMPGGSPTPVENDVAGHTMSSGSWSTPTPSQPLTMADYEALR